MSQFTSRIVIRKIKDFLLILFVFLILTFCLWYVVDPVVRTKKLLFDRDELASQLTEIVKDPFEARHLPIINLKAKEDGRTFTFEVKSTKDATPKKDGKDNKDKKN